MKLGRRFASFPPPRSQSGNAKDYRNDEQPAKINVQPEALRFNRKRRAPEHAREPQEQRTQCKPEFPPLARRTKAKETARAQDCPEQKNPGQQSQKRPILSGVVENVMDEVAHIGLKMY